MQMYKLCFDKMNFRSEGDKSKCQCHPKAKGKVSRRCDRRRRETTEISQRLNQISLSSFQKSISHAASDYQCLHYQVTKGPFWMYLLASDLVYQRARQGEIPVQLLCRRDRLSNAPDTYFLFPCSPRRLVPYLFLALDFPYIMFSMLSVLLFLRLFHCVENFLDIFCSLCNILQCHMPMLNPYPKDTHRKTK